MKLDVRWRFWLAVALQFVVLLGLTAAKQNIVMTGDTIRLATVPVDPRSLFRGDYVILDYVISDLDRGLLEPRAARPVPGDTVFVVLEEGDEVWTPTRVTLTRPSVSPGQVALRGTVQDRLRWDSSSDLLVEYGIESYFVPEGEGRAIERARGRALVVEVAVDARGNGVVRRLLIDGEPFEP